MSEIGDIVSATAADIAIVVLSAMMAMGVLRGWDAMDRKIRRAIRRRTR